MSNDDEQRIEDYFGEDYLYDDGYRYCRYSCACRIDFYVCQETQRRHEERRRRNYERKRRESIRKGTWPKKRKRKPRYKRPFAHLDPWQWLAFRFDKIE